MAELLSLSKSSFWHWRGVRKIIKRLWRTTCVDFYWLIDRNYFHWLMVEITRSLFEKYLSENWWAKICSHKLLMILTEEFDHGSDWTLAAGLTHASRAGKGSLLPDLAADGWVMLRNLPISGGQHSERNANTAYALRGKAGDLRTLR